MKDFQKLKHVRGGKGVPDYLSHRVYVILDKQPDDYDSGTRVVCTVGRYQYRLVAHTVGVVSASRRGNVCNSIPGDSIGVTMTFGEYPDHHIAVVAELTFSEANDLCYRLYEAIKESEDIATRIAKFSQQA